MRKIISTVVATSILSLVSTSLVATGSQMNSFQQVSYHQNDRLAEHINALADEQIRLSKQIHRIDPRIALPEVRFDYSPRGLYRQEKIVERLRQILYNLQQQYQPQYKPKPHAVPQDGIFRDRNPNLDERKRLIANPNPKKSHEYFTIQDLKKLGRIPLNVDTRTLSDQQIYQLMGARKSGKIKVEDVIRSLLQGN